MALSFSSKAGTLKSLQSRLRSARLLPMATITVRRWRDDQLGLWRGIPQLLGPGPYMVRSSCLREDGHKQSNAGAFLSLPNVSFEEIPKAVDRVVRSYGEASPLDEVLIQPMLRDVVRSGVAFSHDPNTCSPYRVISWTDGQDTASVTGGVGGRTWQQAAMSTIVPPSGLEGVMPLLEELLEVFGGIPVDAEFAVTTKDDQETLWLLQARPLVMIDLPESAEAQCKRLRAVESKVTRGMREHPFLLGKRSVFGVMPDWNPAEIVGVRPKPLALSLYRELVTDAIWAYQRHNYGYRNLRSFPLMPHFFGAPYIDVRLSFNSFIPADLDETIAGRLVDYYIERLLSEPMLHDKVEFEIVFSCYTLDLQHRMTRLRDAGFSEEDCEAIRSSLRRLTNRIVHPKEGLWKEDAAKLDTLKERRGRILESGSDALERIYWLIEDGKRYGTLPFAGLARAGFIAVQMLKSLVSVGVFAQGEYDEFLGSVTTVSGQLALDRATMDRSSFLCRYGHLRPGTYDILSPRYDEAPDAYFDWSRSVPAPESKRSFSVTLRQMRQVAELLDRHGLQADPVGLFDFLQAGIELREFAKFEFTRNLAEAMSLMAEYGAEHGLSREDVAYCDVGVFRELHAGADHPRDALRRSMDQGLRRYEETRRLALPPVIARPDDVWAFEWPENSPNFITQKQVTARVVGCHDRDALDGAVVSIPNADPGFDWLFSYPIAGLITAWGGANSHMAIRAGELGLPAVIGAGELLFRKWTSANRLHMDCAGRRVEVLA